MKSSKLGGIASLPALARPRYRKNHFGESSGFQHSVSPIKAGRIYENKLLGAASVNFILNSCADIIIPRKVHERDVHPHFVVEMSEQVSIADETVLLFHEKPRGIGTTIKQVNFWVVVLKVDLLRL